MMSRAMAASSIGGEVSKTTRVFDTSSPNLNKIERAYGDTICDDRQRHLVNNMILAMKQCPNYMLSLHDSNASKELREFLILLKGKRGRNQLI